MQEIPPQVQKQLAQFQQLQQQLETIMIQRQQMELRIREIELANQELEKASDDTPVYKSIGSILVMAKNRDGVKEELSSEKETADIRLKALNRQEDSLKQRIQPLAQQLNSMLEGYSKPKEA